MRSSAGPLATFEISVGGGDYAILRTEALSACVKAHGTARFPPLKPGVAEYSVQPFLFRLPLDRGGAGHTDGAHPLSDFPSLEKRGGASQIANAAVRAGADKCRVYFQTREKIAGRKPHVIQRPLLAFRRSLFRHLIGTRDRSVDRHDLLAGWCPS